MHELLGGDLKHLAPHEFLQIHTQEVFADELAQFVDGRTEVDGGSTPAQLEVTQLLRLQHSPVHDHLQSHKVYEHAAQVRQHTLGADGVAAQEAVPVTLLFFLILRSQTLPQRPR